jgi:dTDP-4-dehydrorhamnose reductase
MSAMKILITGGGGLLGQYLNIVLSRKFEILTLYHEHPGNALNYNHVQGSIEDYRLIRQIMQDFRPQVIVHTAAVSNSSLADKLGKEKTISINVTATENLAKLSADLNATFIFHSTDLVYKESQGDLLNESAPVEPISLYAESKLLAEEKIKESTSKYLILRNALMYGFGLNHSRNHFHTVFEKLRRSEKVKLFTDQFRTPLELSNAAELINNLIEKDIKGTVLNFGGKEKLSRFELGLKLCQSFGFDSSLLIPTLLSETDMKYKVYDVSMDISKLLALGIEPNTVEESFQKMKTKSDITKNG